MHRTSRATGGGCLQLSLVYPPTSSDESFERINNCFAVALVKKQTNKNQKQNNKQTWKLCDKCNLNALGWKKGVKHATG